MENVVTCIRDHYHLKIYINDILHLQLNFDNHDGVQSWYDGNTEQKVYSIEFYRKKGKPILTEYDSKDIWVQILKLLDKKI